MIVLCAHDIVPAPAELIWEVAEEDFETTIEGYLSNGYVPAVLDHLPDAPARSIALTIDDGADGAADWALRRAAAFGISATFFVVVDWLDNPPPRSPDHAYRALAPWRRLVELREAGHTIGSHSLSHVRLPTLPAERLRHELGASKQRIEAALGDQVRHFAAPYGSLSPEVVQAAKDVGYETVSSTVPGTNGPDELRSGVLKRLLFRSDQPGFGIPRATELPQ